MRRFPSPNDTARTARTLLLAGLCAISVSCAHQLVFVALDPGPRFDPSAVPAPPAYSSLDAWAAHPNKKSDADVALDAFPRSSPDQTRADVFFVHTTTWLGRRWNAPAIDAEVTANTAHGSLLIQASAFNACCAVYAPHYRQANGQAFTAPSAAGDQALDVAYSDVLRAFEQFVNRDNPGRPFVLASHSQGSVLAARLLRDRIFGSDDEPRLVAAYLIGGPLGVGELGGVPLCAAPTSTGCVVAFNARGPGFVPNALEFVGPRGPDAHPLEGRVCVNPLSWRADEHPASRARHRGAVFFDTASPRVLPGFSDAVCEGGTLVVNVRPIPERRLIDDVLLDMMGDQNFHPVEFQLFYLNLRENAVRRVAAFDRG